MPVPHHGLHSHPLLFPCGVASRKCTRYFPNDHSCLSRAYLLSTPVELGLTAVPQPRSEAGATEERRLEGVGSRPAMLGPTTPRPAGHPWPTPSRLAHPSRTRWLPRPPCPLEALAPRPRRWFGPRATGRRSPLRPVPWTTARTWDTGHAPSGRLEFQGYTVSFLSFTSTWGTAGRVLTAADETHRSDLPS